MAQEEDQWIRMVEQVDTTFREVLSLMSQANLVRLLPWFLCQSQHRCHTFWVKHSLLLCRQGQVPRWTTPLPNLRAFRPQYPWAAPCIKLALCLSSSSYVGHPCCWHLSWAAIHHACCQSQTQEAGPLHWWCTWWQLGQECLLWDQGSQQTRQCQHPATPLTSLNPNPSNHYPVQPRMMPSPMTGCIWRPWEALEVMIETPVWASVRTTLTRVVKSLNQTESHGRASLTPIWSQELGTASHAWTQRRQQSGPPTRNSTGRCRPLLDSLGRAFWKCPRWCWLAKVIRLWGSNFNVVKEEWDLTLKEDFRSFGMDKVVVQTEQLLQIKEATDMKIFILGSTRRMYMGRRKPWCNCWNSFMHISTSCTRRGMTMPWSAPRDSIQVMPSGTPTSPLAWG